MNWNKIKWRSLLAISMLALALAVVGIPTLAIDQKITVNVGQIVADIDHNLGLGLNFISDRPNISHPLQDLQLGTLRYATNEYFLFDPQQPNHPQVAIQDPSLWQVKSFSKPDGTWWSKLNFDRFMELCQATKAEPFIVVGIDAIAYQGSAPHATPAAVVAAAASWVKYANRTKGYQIKYWEIGNESNISQHEQINWTPEQYGQTVVQLAQAMKAVDPSIKIGANGMKIKQNDDWWSRVMPIVKDDIDFLVTHQYSWQADYPAWRDSTDKYDYNLQDAVAAIATYQPELKLMVTEIGIDPRKIVLLPNGVDLKFLDPQLHQPKRVFSDFTIGFVGSLYSWAGLGLLLEVMAELKTAGYHLSLVVVGDGEMKSTWLAQTRSLGLEQQVKFVGRIPWQEVPQYIAGFDIGYSGQIQLQLGKMYLSPMKLYEYMSMAKPVVASAFEDATRLVTEGETGFLFQPGDKQTLKQALIEAYAAQDRLLLMGQQARQQIEAEHSWANRVEHLLQETEAIVNISSDRSSLT